MIRRRKPLARSKKPLKRSPLTQGHAPTRTKRVPKKRSKPRRIVGVRCPELVAWIRTQPCHVCAKFGREQYKPTECSHMPKGRQSGDWNNCWPLCENHHRAKMAGFYSWHFTRNDFYEFFDFFEDDIPRIAREYTERFVTETGWNIPGARSNW